MNTHPGFEDSEAKRIIERAAEIDAQRRQAFDANALREIAAEAGISPTAVDQAIHERLQPAVPTRSWPARHPALLISIGLAAAILLSRLFP